jgi:apolipoprotein D and lipocalin family protein
MDDDGTIATTFRFRKGGFDGKKKVYTPRGFVRDTGSNAEWGMQFIWPIKGDYRITFLTEDYSRTVVSRNQRDYVWVMARSPHISEAEYQHMLEHVRSSGYDMEQLQKVPQRWPELQLDQPPAAAESL